MTSNGHRQVSPADIVALKTTKTRWVGGSAYEQMDTIWAVLAGIEMVLIGDSLANIKLGYLRTADVTLDEMLTFTKATLRGAEMVARVRPELPLPLFVFDVPYCSMGSPLAVVQACRTAYEQTRDLPVKIGAVKIEAHQNDPQWREKAAALRAEGIPFIVHIGYTPQIDVQVDEKIVQGKTRDGALYLASLTAELQHSGAFAIFVESIPWQLGELLTSYSALPIIGLGAGPHTDGIWLMVSDVLGLTASYFALQRRGTPVFSPIQSHPDGLEPALSALVRKVRAGEYPVIGQHTYALPAAKAGEILEAVGSVLGTAAV